MKSGWLWLAPVLAVGLGAFGGCGSDSDENPSAGTTSGGSGGSGANAAGAGTSHGGTDTMNAGASTAGEPSLGECDKADCGPQLGLANWTCADGSLGGPTGRCLRLAGGACGWEINNCPMAGEGGASSQGGQANAAGEPALGGAATNGCGECSAGQICVLQGGGPGPTHFTCATRNPCGAAAACSCIVGQGTCQPNLMGTPPGYCLCDNGLE